MASRSRRRSTTAIAPTTRSARPNCRSSRRASNCARRAAGAAERVDLLHGRAARHGDSRPQRSNVQVLTEQLRQTRDRFNVGELTRTDVAQAELRSRRRRLKNSAPRRSWPIRSPNIASSSATSRRTCSPSRRSSSPCQDRQRGGGDLAIRAPADRRPVAPRASTPRRWRSRSRGRAAADRRRAGQRLTAMGSAVRFRATGSSTGQLTGTVNVPIYDGGATYSGIRAAKERSGSRN